MDNQKRDTVVDPDGSDRLREQDTEVFRRAFDEVLKRYAETFQGLAEYDKRSER